MESSDNNATPISSAAESRRRSGRVKKAPQKYSPDVEVPTTKRKRARENDDEAEEDGENGDAEIAVSPAEPEDGTADDDGMDTDESAPEEPARPPKKSRTKTKKPAAKRAKVNGNAPSASAPADVDVDDVRLPSRPKKNVRVAIARRDGEGLYAEIFTSGDSSDDVAAHWFQRYQANDAEALADLMNCVLLAAGCDQQLTADDIRDPENSANKLSELEEAYEQTSISDYPLISRAKSSKNFREVLISFFESLVGLLHQTDDLYTDANLLDNIQRWVGTMSSSALRPFRHTATTVGLSLLSAMIEVTKQLDDRISKSNLSLQAEQSRKGKNKSLVANTQKALDAANENRQIIDEKVKDLFNIVFVHRYRDIDPKIRAECVEALGTWICSLPTVYMAPEYLRYLGWLLSDVAVPTRHEVLKQLGRVLKRDAEKLAHFIDRFRPRLVEMATKDAEVTVRVAAVAVVDILRSSGMLEPEEVDSVCKLLFDTEARVRKAVVPFFVDLVQEFIANKIDEIGGNDVIDDVFGDQDEDDYSSLRRDWINIKALAENLAVYNSQLDEEQDEIRHGLDVAAEVVNANIPETRIAFATQALYEKMAEINNWQVLAGYLLFDHTTSSRSKKSKTNSVEASIRSAVAPTPAEEAILIEVLATAVKESFVQGGGDHERTKKRVGRLDAEAEDSGMQLAATIPSLLNKFGSDPHAAGIILRLEHYLDLDVFQQLRQNSATYYQLLDEVTTQFSRHVDQTVLNEAATALIHARQYEELEEVVDSKLSVLWDDAVNALRNYEKSCELSARGNLDKAALIELANILKKISKLASVGDCIEVLETPGSDDSAEPPIKVLISIVYRGFLAEPDEELDDPEDEVVAFAIKACQFYFMWKVRRLQASIQNEEDIPNAYADQLVLLRRSFVGHLIKTLSSRGFNDDLRLSATGSLCDCCTLFVFLRPVVEGPQGDKYRSLRPLLEELPPALIPAEIIPIFDAAERAYAKRARKGLNDPTDDEDPVDDEAPPEDDEDEELTELERQAAELKAEKILCELTSKLVMAILAKVLDNSPPHAGKLRKRLNRNKNKLGPNFKEVVAFLDEDHLREMRGGKKKPSRSRAKETATSKTAKSAEIAVDDDDDEENAFEEAEPEEGSREDLRNRELIDDPIEDDDDDAEEPVAPEPMEEESVLGD